MCINIQVMNSSATAHETRIGIVGVSGYSGMELARLAAAHPRFKLTLATCQSWPGQLVGDNIAVGGEAGRVRAMTHDEGRKLYDQVDVLFLCTPAEVSIELAPIAMAAGAKVIDLSGGFRLPAADYPRWYGFEHPRPDLLAQAVYSMPEATGNLEALRAAKLVSNPGCYPTACTMAVLPLLLDGIIEPEGIIIDAKSGTTGAGRKADEALSFSEVDENLRAYRVLSHQHTPEIEMVLAQGSGAKLGPVVFTPHLLPVLRGILVTAYGRLKKGKTSADAAAAMARFAEGKRFIRAVAKPDAVSLNGSVHTNRVVVGAAADPARGVAVATSSIDNLTKGAAGQAIQNANLMLGYDEAMGLPG